MAKYPFDPKFYETVKNLPEFGGEGWEHLIKYSNSEALKALAVLGYSKEVVEGYVTALLNLPIEELFELAVGDQAETSPALMVLQKSSVREVFDIAVKLSESELARERAVAVLTLMRSPGVAFKAEATVVVTDLATHEADDRVTEALCYALTHLDVEGRSECLRRASESPLAATRFAAAYGLGGLNDEVAIQCLIALSRDVDDDVRDWATFGLHLGLEEEQTGREDVRNAFFDRIDDPHEDTKYEAIEGLAICKDPRGVGPLLVALSCDEVWDIAIEAAERMATSELLPALLALRQDGYGEKLDRAIASCTPQVSLMDQD